MQPVFITERQVKEEIFDSGDALLGQNLGNLRTDAFHKLNRSVELHHSAMLSQERAQGSEPRAQDLTVPEIL